MNAEQKLKLMETFGYLADARGWTFNRQGAIDSLNKALISIMEIKHELADMV